MNEAIDFWKRINFLIKNSGTKQQSVAELCNIPYQTFRGWVTRQVFPDALQSVKIAKALNTTVEYLVTGVEPEPAYKVPDDLMEVMKKYVE